MAKAPGTEFHEKLSDVTECSVCTEIFTNPKSLPCVHTFCLHCLENYGKDKKPEDQMVCPICRNEFAIPDGGLSNLPNNFFIAKIVEIGKLATVTAKNAVCDQCFEEEAVAKKFCIDCEHKLCDRCSKSHLMKDHFQNHQVVELGSQLNVQELSFRNSHCDRHPNELIKMYCYEDNVAICLICCVERHHSHRCANVDKAAGEFVERLKEDMKTVTNRLAQCEEVEQKLLKHKKEFTEQISETEENIRETGTKLKKLIDDHTEILIQNLKSATERNMKVFESTKQDMDRFKVMSESYSRYSEELISQGSSVDICKAADQMHSRANKLEKRPANGTGDRFRCDAVSFQPSSFDNFLEHCNSDNIVGELTITESPDLIIQFEDGSSDKQLPRPKSSFHTSFSTIKVSGIPRDVSRDMISLYFENKKLSGGGKHTVLEHHVEEGKAVIKFDNPEDALNVCKRRHVLCGATLKISAPEMLLDGIRSCATEVKSLGERATENFIESYFKKKGRSGNHIGPFFFRH